MVVTIMYGIYIYIYNIILQGTRMLIFAVHVN